MQGLINLVVQQLSEATCQGFRRPTGLSDSLVADMPPMAAFAKAASDGGIEHDAVASLYQVTKSACQYFTLNLPAYHAWVGPGTMFRLFLAPHANRYTRYTLITGHLHRAMRPGEWQTTPDSDIRANNFCLVSCTLCHDNLSQFSHNTRPDDDVASSLLCLSTGSIACSTHAMHPGMMKSYDTHLSCCTKT